MEDEFAIVQETGYQPDNFCDRVVEIEWSEGLMQYMDQSSSIIFEKFLDINLDKVNVLYLCYLPL